MWKALHAGHLCEPLAMAFICHEMCKQQIAMSSPRRLDEVDPTLMDVFNSCVYSHLFVQLVCQ